MRCRFCGSKAIYPYKNHEQAGAGRVIAGAIIAGTVGAIAGLAGKNVNGYRCSACGMFSEQPMDSGEEALLNYEISNARNGNARIYERYKEKYANLEFVPARQEVKQELYQLPVEHYENASAQLPVAERAQESVKHSYSPNQYIVGSPIFISNITIQDDNGTDTLLLDVKNISGKTLRSVYLNITVYDDVGDQISTNTFAFQGLSATTGEQLPQAKPFNLNTNVAYRVDVICEKAAFTDDTVWRNEGNPVIYTVPEKTELVPESFAQYKYLQMLLTKKGALKTGEKLYYPVIEETHRLCICGNPVVNANKCPVCGLDEADLQEVMDYDVLIQCRKDVIVKTAKERTEALQGFIEQRREDTYQKALRLMEEESYAEALQLFKSVVGHKDAELLIEKCKEKVEIFQKDKTYYLGMMFAEDSEQSVENYTQAIAEFEKIPGWKDANAKITICQQKIQEIKAQEEAERIEREKEAEIARAEAAARAKRNKTVAIIVGAVVCAAIAFLIVLNTIIIPDGKYNDAIALMESSKYSDAISAFEALDGYKDSADKIAECTTAILDGKYATAVELMNNGKYKDAERIFAEIEGHKDSKDLLNECIYQQAVAFRNSKDWDAANPLFERIKGYKDSATLIHYHKHSIVDEVEVTCTSAGYKTYVCDCGEGYTDNFQPLGHDYIEATCTSAKGCSRCGITEGAPLGHTTGTAKCGRCDTIMFTPLTWTNAGKENNHSDDFYIYLADLPEGRYILTVTSTVVDNYDYPGEQKLYVSYNNGKRQESEDVWDFNSPKKFKFACPENKNGHFYIIPFGAGHRWTITLEAY